MGSNEIINEAINLKPQERYLIIETLVKSLNQPDEEIEQIWIEESQKRLNDYKEGKLKTLSYKDVFSS